MKHTIEWHEDRLKTMQECIAKELRAIQEMSNKIMSGRVLCTARDMAEMAGRSASVKVSEHAMETYRKTICKAKMEGRDSFDEDTYNRKAPISSVKRKAKGGQLAA